MENLAERSEAIVHALDQFTCTLKKVRERGAKFLSLKDTSDYTVCERAGKDAFAAARDAFNYLVQLTADASDIIVTNPDGSLHTEVDCVLRDEVTSHIRSEYPEYADTLADLGRLHTRMSDLGSHIRTLKYDEHATHCGILRKIDNLFAKTLDEDKPEGLFFNDIYNLALDEREDIAALNDRDRDRRNVQMTRLKRIIDAIDRVCTMPTLADTNPVDTNDATNDETYRNLALHLNADGALNVLLLPEQLVGKDGAEYTRADIAPLFDFNWHMVADLSTKDDKAFLTPQRAREFTNALSPGQVRNINAEGVWYYVKGLTLDPDSVQRREKEYLRDLRMSLETLMHSRQATHVNIVCPYGVFDGASSTSRYRFSFLGKAIKSLATYVCEQSNVTICVALLSDNARIPAQYINDDLVPDLEEVLEEQFTTTVCTLLYEVTPATLGVLITDDKCLIGRRKARPTMRHQRWDDIFATADIKRSVLANVGIEIVETRDARAEQAFSETREWSFYQGDTITWNDLENQLDAPRMATVDITRGLKNMVEKSNEVRVYYILEQPGSGSTTLLRRLCYDFDMMSRAGALRVPLMTALIKDSTSFENKIQMLIEISKALGNDPLLVFLDKSVDTIFIDTLLQRARQSARNIAVCSVRRLGAGRTLPVQKNVGRISSTFESPTEKGGFIEKYIIEDRRLRGTHINRSSAAMMIQELAATDDAQVIHFPLTLELNQTNDNLAKAVTRYVSDNLERVATYNDFIGLLAFIAKYTGAAVSGKLVDGAIAEHLPRPWMIQAPTVADREVHRTLIDVMNSLFKRGKGSRGEYTLDYEPRFNLFGDKIIECAFRDKALSQIANMLIKTVARQHRDNNGLLETFEGLFVNINDKRDDYQESSRLRFTKLVQAIINNEGVLSAQRVFDTLIDAFPDNPFYRAHLARILYSHANDHYDEASGRPVYNGRGYDDPDLIEADKLLNEAVNLNIDDDSTIYHMRGMWYKVLITKLSSEFNEHSRKGEPQRMSAEDMRSKTLLWLENACEWFDKAVSFDPFGAYGITSKAQTQRNAINNLLAYSGHDLLDTEYIEKDTRLGEIIDDFGKTMQKLNQLIMSRTLEQNRNSDVQRLLEFEYRLRGYSEERLNYYYEKCLDNSTEPARRAIAANCFIDGTFRSVTAREQWKTGARLQCYSNINAPAHANLRQKLFDVFRSLESHNQLDVRGYASMFMIKLYSDPDIEPIYPDDDEIVELLGSWRSSAERMKDTISVYEYLQPFFYSGVMATLNAMNRNRADLQTNEAKKYFDICVDTLNAAKVNRGNDAFDERWLATLYEKRADSQDPIPVQALVSTSPATQRMRLRGILHEGNVMNGRVTLNDYGIVVSVRAINYPQGERYTIPLEGEIRFRYRGPGMFDAQRVSPDTHRPGAPPRPQTTATEPKAEPQTQPKTEPQTQPQTESQTDPVAQKLPTQAKQEPVTAPSSNSAPTPPATKGADKDPYKGTEAFKAEATPKSKWYFGVIEIPTFKGMHPSIAPYDDGFDRPIQFYDYLRIDDDEFSVNDYEDDDAVMFHIKQVPHPKRPGQSVYVATDIKPDDFAE